MTEWGTSSVGFRLALLLVALALLRVGELAAATLR